MQITEYRYQHGTEERLGYRAIPELHRLRPAAPQFIRMNDLNIVLTRPTAFLYVDGYSMSPSNSGLNPVTTKNFMPALKTGSAHTAHEWVHTFEGKQHLKKVDIISSTCAAGIQALYEAEKLLTANEVEEVIIIGGERITEDTLRLFRELKIPVTCSDGFAYFRVEAGNQITDINWDYVYHTNPFYFEAEDLNKHIPEYQVDYVKLHGTGTLGNTRAEEDLAQLGTTLLCKPFIGHTQGISALVELGIVLDDPSTIGKVLVAANGAGGFFGTCTLNKLVENGTAT